jgi:hypothetical protein
MLLDLIGRSFGPCVPAYSLLSSALGCTALFFFCQTSSSYVSSLTQAYPPYFQVFYGNSIFAFDADDFERIFEDIAVGRSLPPTHVNLSLVVAYTTGKDTMRLLNSYTLHFQTFLSDDACPPYAILSHTWGAEEVSYQDMMYERVFDDLNQDLGDAPVQAALVVAARIQFSKSDGVPTKERRGYQKIVKGAQIARERHLDYFWIDTCCINKESSTELQEAINSMWRWYQRSTYCIVYLEDDPREIFADQWLQTTTQVDSTSRSASAGGLLGDGHCRS